MKLLFRPLFTIFIALVFISTSFGQGATLSFQGILKKSNGTAVEDGEYSITFSLYNVDAGGTALWTETQPAVEVTSGIYSVLLGSVTPLNISFNEIYFLGIKVGSTEMTPRFRLTSAPYALSLIGENNTFPSTGTVVVDNITAKAGTPTTNPADNGYSFGPGGDEDGGMFSAQDGELAFYVDGAVRIELKTDPNVSTIIHGALTTNDITVVGDVSTNNLNLPQNGKVSYNGNDGWRLVYVSDFENGVDGWEGYDRVGTNGWGTNTTQRNLSNPVSSNPFLEKKVLKAQDGLNGAPSLTLLKKQIQLNNQPHTEVKVEFNIIAFGTWDGEFVYAGFQENFNQPMTVAFQRAFYWLGSSVNFNTLGLDQNDMMYKGEMIAHDSGDSFWMVFGCALDQLGNNEDFALSDVKVWIR